MRSARPRGLIGQRVALQNALVNGVIANQLYAYNTSSNSPVVYNLNYRTFVAGNSGEDSGRAVGEGGSDDENCSVA